MAIFALYTESPANAPHPAAKTTPTIPVLRARRPPLGVLEEPKRQVECAAVVLTRLARELNRHGAPHDALGHVAVASTRGIPKTVDAGAAVGAQAPIAPRRLAGPLHLLVDPREERYEGGGAGAAGPELGGDVGRVGLVGVADQGEHLEEYVSEAVLDRPAGVLAEEIGNGLVEARTSISGAPIGIDDLAVGTREVVIEVVPSDGVSQPVLYDTIPKACKGDGFRWMAASSGHVCVVSGSFLQSQSDRNSRVTCGIRSTDKGKPYLANPLCSGLC